jgi:hypothetical protein
MNSESPSIPSTLPLQPVCVEQQQVVGLQPRRRRRGLMPDAYPEGRGGLEVQRARPGPAPDQQGRRMPCATRRVYAQIVEVLMLALIGASRGVVSAQAHYERQHRK